MADFLQQLLRHFRAQDLADLSPYSFPLSTFSLIFKGFNIRHKLFKQNLMSHAFKMQQRVILYESYFTVTEWMRIALNNLTIFRIIVISKSIIGLGIRNEIIYFHGFILKQMKSWHRLQRMFHKRWDVRKSPTVSINTLQNNLFFKEPIVSTHQEAS